jgi:hypothetical protein
MLNAIAIKSVALLLPFVHIRTDRQWAGLFKMTRGFSPVVFEKSIKKPPAVTMTPAHGEIKTLHNLFAVKKLVKTGSPVYIYWARGSDGRNKSVCGAAVKVTLIRD